MRQRGFTLIEVIMTAGLFLLAMVLVGQLAVMGMRTRMLTVDKNQAFRDGTIMLEALNRDLAHCARVVLPAPLATGAAVHGLVLETYSSRGATPRAFVGYHYSAAQHTVTRLIYDPGFQATVAATHIAGPNERPQTCAWVQSFDVTALDPVTRNGTNQLRCELTISAGEPDRPQPGLKLMTETEVPGP